MVKAMVWICLLVFSACHLSKDGHLLERRQQRKNRPLSMGVERFYAGQRHQRPEKVGSTLSERLWQGMDGCFPVKEEISSFPGKRSPRDWIAESYPYQENHGTPSPSAYARRITVAFSADRPGDGNSANIARGCCRASLATVVATVVTVTTIAAVLPVSGPQQQE